MRQTNIQEDSSIRQGSIRVLIGDDFGSLVDIGALRNPIVTALAENQEVEFDNVNSKKKFVKGKKVQITFDLAEINLDNLAVLDDGIMNLTTIAASLVPGAVDTVLSGAWNYNDFIKILNQNGDGSAIVINSVTGATDGALVLDTDYFIAQDANGNYGINVIDSATVTTEGQDIVIDYDYTPNASKNVTFNDSGSKNLKVMRLINIDENSKEFRFDIENGTNFAPISIDFAGDEEDDVAIQPIDFQGDFVEWVDEQNV